MKALVHTINGGYQLYNIKGQEKAGYILYANENSPGTWYAYSENVIIVNNNETIKNLKKTNPEYFL